LSFISEEEIKKRFDHLFKQGKLDPKCFSKSGASYDLRLGREVFVTPEKEPKQLRQGQTLNIEPGQFAVLTTEEYLEMPQDLLGFITVRFTYKSKGLVNISGFHVDPGFNGKLIFSVYNTGPATVTMRHGDKVFSIFFAEIHPRTSYQGDYNGQQSIPIGIVETLAGARIPSLQALEEKVNRNWTTLKIYGTILTGLVVALLSVVIGAIQGLIG
jgi:dCTP deaminase